LPAIHGILISDRAIRVKALFARLVDEKESVDLLWLCANVKTSWRYRASVADFGRRLCWTYAHRLPAALQRERIIGFRLPEPVGSIRLLLRANAGSDRFIYSEVFEHQCYRIPVARPPATILDLGANIGLSAIYLARCFPDAHLACVEPAPENLRLLSRNLELNGVEADVISAAVDAKDGKVWLERSSLDYGHKIAAAGNRPSPALFEANAMSIQSILQRLNWNRIGLLKMDIEGHEKILLTRNSDWLHLVDTLCLELHDEFPASELMRVAKDFGFSPPTRLPGGIWLLAR
jgi:FkbM family methyltransferase